MLRAVGAASSRVTRIAVLIAATIPTTAVARIDQELAGSRSEAMGGAHVGLGTSNDTIVLNPAGMAMFRRYSIDVVYSHSGQDTANQFSLSAVDSQTGPVAGAVAYSFSKGDGDGLDWSLHRITMASSYTLGQGLAVGFSGRHIRGKFTNAKGQRQSVAIYSGDIGVSALISQRWGVGFNYRNVWTSGRRHLTPPAIDVGAAYNGEALVLSSNVVIDLRDRRKGDVGFGVGGEYLLANEFPLRFGYRFVPVRQPNDEKDLEHILGGGVAWVSKTGGIEVTYTHSLTNSDNWDIFATLKFFIVR